MTFCPYALILKYFPYIVPYPPGCHNKPKTNSVALSPQANYTDWATATCRRNLVPTFSDRRLSRDHRGGSPTVVNLSYLDRNHQFSFKQLLICQHEAEWTPFQTHCYSENLVAPGIEPRTSGLAARKSDHLTTEAALSCHDIFCTLFSLLLASIQLLCSSNHGFASD
jgi:hypothetical protein